MMIKAAVALLLLYSDDSQLKRREALPENAVKRIPIKLLNTITLRTGVRGDHAYMQTIFPVQVSGRTVIPSRSYLDAEVAEVRKFERAKGRVELNLKLGRLTLPNHDQRDLHGRAGSMSAVTSTRGADIVIVPGTTADIIMEDPLVFPLEEVRDR